MTKYRFFDKPFIDLLKNQVILSHTVRPYVPLKSTGNQKYVGLCPFHKEKTPSFSVNDRDGFYYCFGCHASGDVITFVMQMRHVSYPEAVTFLAEGAGMVLPNAVDVQEHRAKSEQKVQDYQLLQVLMQYFQDALKTDLGQQARQYLTLRGVTEASITTFALGYAPNTKTFIQNMERINISDQWLYKMGFIKNDFFLFSDRLIFPIFMRHNLVCGFGGRALRQNQMPKYINSQESDVFHKSRVLYVNPQFEVQSKTNPHAYTKTKEDIYIVEGYMDVIALNQIGLTGYAPLGTAIHHQQLTPLLQKHKKLILCFDQDQAGRSATLRAMDIIYANLRPDMKVSFLSLPEGLDPDTYIQQMGRDETGKNFFLNLEQFSLFDQTARLLSSTSYTPEDIAKTMDSLFQYIQKIPSQNLQSVYRLWTRRLEWNLVNRKTRTHQSVMPSTITKEQSFVAGEQRYQALSVIYAFMHYPLLLYTSPVLLERLKLPSPYDKVIHALQLYTAEKASSLDQDLTSFDNSLEKRALFHYIIKEKELESVVVLSKKERQIFDMLYPKIQENMPVDDVQQYVKNYINEAENSLQHFYTS